ncbi:MAG: helix-turn-helix domain-containing protein [Candidatus Humimicrobiaceae bacterium]
MNKAFTDTTIKHIRKMANFKQQELADLLGINVTEFSFIENKKVFPSLEVAQKIAEHLKVTVGYLYAEEELNYMRFRESK